MSAMVADIQGGFRRATTDFGCLAFVIYRKMFLRWFRLWVMGEPKGSRHEQ